jgi:hypothetical protein
VPILISKNTKEETKMRNHETAVELDNPSSSAKIAAYSGTVKVYFYKENKEFSRIPIVGIVNELRSILCNSKVKIEPYNVSNKNGYIEINLPKNIRGSLSN